MAVQYKDYYETLGVPRTASADEIKKSFRKLARQYHPDVAKDKKKRRGKIQGDQRGLRSLERPGQAQKIRRTRRELEIRRGIPPAARLRKISAADKPFAAARGASAQDFEFEFGGTGFSDFFEQLFGSRMRGGGFGRRGNFAAGRSPPSAAATSKATSWSRWRRPRAVRCAPSMCAITSALDQNRNASGQDSGRRDRRTKIAPGRTRRTRRARRRRRAICILRVRLAKHPDFDVEDHNLIYEAELAPWEAVLGAEISVPTLDGRVNIKIPPGTQVGQKLRVRGRGLPQRDGSHGDLIVVTRMCRAGKNFRRGEKIVGTTGARIEIQSAKLN